MNVRADSREGFLTPVEKVRNQAARHMTCRSWWPDGVDQESLQSHFRDCACPFQVCMVASYSKLRC